MDTKKLRQKILDLAIRGKLVPQDPNDEPASVLLERIRAEKERLIKEGKIKRSKKTASDMPNNEDEMFEVPKGWCWCYIDDLCDVVRGGSPRPAGSKEFYDGDIPFLKVADLTRDNFMYVTYAQNSIKEAGLVKTRQIEVNTLLLTNSGATLGVPKINTFPATINDGIAAFLYLPQELQYYMYWFLKANTGRFRGFNQGAAQPNLNTDIIKNVRVPLPPVNEQKRIVNEIDRWYAELEVMESNEGDLLKAINLAKSKILDLAIHGKLVPQDPNDEPANELLKRINPKFEPCDAKNCPYEVPNVWTFCNLQDVFTITMGSSPTGESLNRNGNGIEFHQGKLCFTEIYLEKSDVYTTQPVKLASPNSSLFCVRAPVGVVNINEREVCIGRGLCSMAPLKAVNLMYGFYALQTCQTDFEQKATGSTFKAIGGDVIKNQIIPLPPYQEQLRIVAKIEELFAVLDSIKESLDN